MFPLYFLFSIFVLVLQSTHVERFSVFCMRVSFNSIILMLFGPRSIEMHLLSCVYKSNQHATRGRVYSSNNVIWTVQINKIDHLWYINLDLLFGWWSNGWPVRPKIWLWAVILDCKNLRLYNVFLDKIAYKCCQRWKNVWVCEQCLCKFFHSLGKIFNKFYAVLSQKWVILQFCAFWGETYGFKLGIFFYFYVKKRKTIIYDINIASIVVWRSYFAHTCCQIQFMLFCCKFTCVVIYTPNLGKIVLAQSLLLMQLHFDS